MFKAIERFCGFALKLLLVAFIFAWLEQVLDSVINRFARKWRTRGTDPRLVSADEMEEYYRVHGIQCQNCKCWIPAEAGVCPVCNNNQITGNN
jgi:hypothetical protein